MWLLNYGGKQLKSTRRLEMFVWTLQLRIGYVTSCLKAVIAYLLTVGDQSEVVKSYSMIHIEAECERGVKLLDSRTSLKLAKLLGQRGRMPAATSPFS